MAKGQKTGGRQKGTPNKVNAELKEMILTALDDCGGVEYLKARAADSPVAFMGLLGKVLPMTVQGPGDNGEHSLVVEVVRFGSNPVTK